MDSNLNQLLKWSVENSDASRNDVTASTDPNAEPLSNRGISAEALASLMGGPSDADLMRASMAAIQSPDISLENKLVAFDNLEQLIETIDNANNMESLGLWTPLVQQLESEEAELRKMGAWCIGTAVQNNVKAQDRLVVLGAIPIIVKLAVNDPSQAVRRKAIYALSSEIRNYQLGLDKALEALPEDLRGSNKLDAGDMDGIDGIMEKLRERAKQVQ